MTPLSSRSRVGVVCVCVYVITGSITDVLYAILYTHTYSRYIIISLLFRASISPCERVNRRPDGNLSRPKFEYANREIIIMLFGKALLGLHYTLDLRIKILFVYHKYRLARRRLYILYTRFDHLQMRRVILSRFVLILLGIFVI